MKQLFFKPFILFLFSVFALPLLGFTQNNKYEKSVIKEDYEVFLSGNYSFLNKKNIGFGAGGNLILASDKKLNVLIGFSYIYNSQEFSRFTGGHSIIPSQDNGEFLAKTHYLSIAPIYIRYYLSKRINLFLSLGLYGDILLGKSVKQLPELKESSYELDKIKYGSFAGVGCKFPLKNNNLFLRTEYKFSFYDISQEGHKTSYASISLGLEL